MLFEIEHEMVEFDRGVSRLKHKPVLRAAAFVELRETHPFCGESWETRNANELVTPFCWIRLDVVKKKKLRLTDSQTQPPVGAASDKQ